MWLEGSVSMSSLQFHFLQTLEHRTDVSVTSTSLGGKLQRSGERPGWGKRFGFPGWSWA
uniref:Uncharacterized protein n=1 Tax=Calidris pygmaea TaxID=425635 RepID=A0A8C3KHP3_9CHAR